jgi:hypothetical protein
MSISSHKPGRRWRAAFTGLAVGALALLSVPAFADNIYQDIGASGTATATLANGSAETTVNYYLDNNGASACTASSSVHVIYDVTITGAPSGVSASPSQLEFSACNTNIPVTFTSDTAGSWPVTLVEDATSDARANPANAALTLTINAGATNTKPSVSVTGFTDGATYELGVDTLPTAMCAVTDDTDIVAPFAAVMSGTLTHGLGTRTATCNYTDTGGLAADTATASYTIQDTIDPTINHALSGGTINGNNWYKADVTVTFTCADTPGSGIQSCLADGESGPAKTLGEGANQSVGGTATDWAGNTNTDTASGISIDKTAPSVSLVGGPANGGTYYYNFVPSSPSCNASDLLSGLDGTCSVTGYDTTLGSHTVTATATDMAGNQNSASATYTVLAWTLNGFYAPVDMNGVLNTVKGGSTVPLKFEIFAGTTELTDTADIASFTTKKINCDLTATQDPIEQLATTGGTSLRYDTTGGQFIQNWKTPTGSACYSATMTALDGSTITAFFKTK